MEEQLQLQKPAVYFRPISNAIYNTQNENAHAFFKNKQKKLSWLTNTFLIGLFCYFN